MPKPRHPVFHAVWWGCNPLLAAAFSGALFVGLREFGLCYYVDGFSDAIAAFYFTLSGVAMIFLLVVRFLLGWYADSRLRIPRFDLRDGELRASVAFFSAPEIKE